MQKSPSPYLHHIIDAISSIKEYLEGVDEGQFKSNQLIQDAVIRQLEIIGEACSSLEDDFRDTRPNIPWKEIIGMRNRLAHEYWDVDIDLIWETVIEDTPKLQKQLLKLLSEVGK